MFCVLRSACKCAECWMNENKNKSMVNLLIKNFLNEEEQHKNPKNENYLNSCIRHKTTLN